MDPPGPADRHPLRAPAAVRGSSSPVSQRVATYAGTSGERSCPMDVVLVRLACGARGFPASYQLVREAKLAAWNFALFVNLPLA